VPADDADSDSDSDSDVRQPPRKRQKLGSRGLSLGPSSPSSSPAATGVTDVVARPSSPTPSSESSGSSSSSPAGPSSSELNSPELELELDDRTRTPPPSSLPRFPLPSRPRVPEKSELASQGLDRGLARAQLVNPMLTTPLSLDDEDSGAGLSARTLRRLREQGIVELFAGACVLVSCHSACSGIPPGIETCKLSPDGAAAIAPPFRTSETVFVPPLWSSERYLRVCSHWKRQDTCLRSPDRGGMLVPII